MGPLFPPPPFCTPQAMGYLELASQHDPGRAAGQLMLLRAWLMLLPSSAGGPVAGGAGLERGGHCSMGGAGARPGPGQKEKPGGGEGPGSGQEGVQEVLRACQEVIHDLVNCCDFRALHLQVRWWSTAAYTPQNPHNSRVPLQYLQLSSAPPLRYSSTCNLVMPPLRYSSTNILVVPPPPEVL